MRRYRVFEPPGAEGRTEGALFLRDGFRPWALVVPGLWLLGHRLWVWAVAAFLAEGLAMVALPAGGGLPGAFLSLLVGLGVALEGPSLRARQLARRGWREAGTLWAAGERDAELFYFAGETIEASERDTTPSIMAPPPSSRGLGLSLFDLRSA